MLIIIFGGYQLVGYLPSSHNVLHLTQTFVALLAIAALVVLVTQHHLREGQVLTEAQEELILIGGFGLFWLAMMVAWQAYSSRGVGPSSAAVAPTVDVRGAGQGSGTTGGQRGCSPDAAYCFVEEWSYSYR